MIAAKVLVKLPVLLFTLSLCVSSLEGVTHKQHGDSSAPDETDMDVIDDFLKNPGPGRSDHPNRGSLDNSTETSTTASSSNSNLPTKKTASGDECKCVKYYSCIMEEPTHASEGNTTNDGSNNSTGEGESQNIYGKVDVRIPELRNQLGSNATNSTEEFLCESYFDVCCPLKNIKEEAGSITPATPSPSGDNHGSHKSCGHRNENGVGFKMTGATEGEAQFGEFPWVAAVIQMETNEDNVLIHKYIGGGALLHPQVVLTVAHNVMGKNRSTIKIRVGEWDTQNNDEPFPSQDRKVQKVIIHEQFLMKTLYNDIALLILDEEVRFAPNVDTICLPPLNKKNLKFDNQMCFSAGWGKDNFGAEGRYSEIMKKVSVPVVAKDKCQEELSKSEKLPKFHLDKSFMCAGGAESGQDTCKGDGGSPLVCSLPGNEHSHYVAVGLVSWGLGCGSTIYPGVYTDVQFLTPWILKHMEKEGMSTEYCSLQN